ncbi:unnamed protein product, partial [Brugia timori]|uniref:WD_REPEATS_REGION domain-containing protein n=1 Tax=Brugia timori TaxID=42155 RepID=A0A0R3QHH6_9BILA
MFRDVRWLSSRRQQFVALSAEQIAFYEDVGEVRPKLLQGRGNGELKQDRITCSLHYFGTADYKLLIKEWSIFQDHLQCFDLSPLSDEALALGYANGRVVVTKVAAEPDIR